MKSKPKISQWKSCSTNHLYFPPPNPMILKAFAELFATKMKPTKCLAKGKKKKTSKKRETRGDKRKQKVKFETALSLLNPKAILEFCFLPMCKLQKLIFGSLKPETDQNIRVYES